MKKYTIEWETDFCEDFPEKNGFCTVEANSEDEAAQKFYAKGIIKAVIIGITEERNDSKC